MLKLRAGWLQVRPPATRAARAVERQGRADGRADWRGRRCRRGWGRTARVLTTALRGPTKPRTAISANSGGADPGASAEARQQRPTVAQPPGMRHQVQPGHDL